MKNVVQIFNVIESFLYISFPSDLRPDPQIIDFSVSAVNRLQD